MKESERIVKSFTLMDDEFVSRVFADDKPLTEFLLKRILGFDGFTVLETTTQYEIKNLVGRSVRLDIHAIDDQNRPFDVEIQRSRRGSGARRARYYGSMMDANLDIPLDPSFSNLPDSYVIFITEHDVFGQGKALYKIERSDEEGRPFDDGLHIIYVNGEYCGTDPLGDLIHDFRCSIPREMRCEELRKKVEYLKGSPKELEAMSPAVEDYGEKKYLEGVMEKQVKDILALMESLNVDSSKAMDYLKVPEEERPQITEALKQLN